jgi:hypothetical protein
MQQSIDGNRRARVWQALSMLIGAAALAGCAGGAWLDSPSESDLPLGHTQSYPTAVGQDRGAAAHLDDSEADAPREEKPHPLPATPLAAVPAHLRQFQKAPQPIAIKTPNAPAEPIAITMPPRAADAPSIPPTSPVTPAAAPANPVAPVSNPAEPPVSVPLAAGPNIVQPLSPPAAAAASAAEAVPKGDAGAAVAASEDRQAIIERARGELTAALEAEIRERRAQNSADEELPRLEQQLRLLYVAANRLDDAVTSVESLDEPQREAFKNAMFGVGVWMSPDEARRAPLRSAKVLRSLRDATTELAAASKLELRTLAFCERVEQFGWFTEFTRNEFRPKQQVILYVEIENFAAEKKGATYETELQGSYQIFDEGGRIVAERQLPLDRETCRNYRRDYFLAYPMYLPDTIEPGRYRLELTVEDLKASGEYQGRKFGEGMIEFAIRQ